MFHHDGLVLTFMSSFCVLYMFIMQLVMLIYNLKLHHIINEYKDLIFEITFIAYWTSVLIFLIAQAK